MNIVLIAHDKKKELMADFCVAYRSILKDHSLFATSGTGSIIIEAANLNVHRLAHRQLGEQQIAARVALNEIDLVIYFRDPSMPHDNASEASSLLSLCDTNNIPFATNIASAELLVKGIENGDLSWRELVNPLYNRD